MSSNLPAELTLTEIAHRIRSHLKRLEAADYKRSKGSDRARFYCAGACQAGAYVQVRYISYQGSSNLTKAHALHYLDGLDQGYDRSHHTYFQTVPPPEGPEPEIRFTSLIRVYGGPALYGVTKRTEKRVYGRRVAGPGICSKFEPRGVVVKLQATQQDLDDYLEAVRIRDKEEVQARVNFRKRIEEIQQR